VLVRTIPSGGSVFEGDTRLRETGGGYQLPVGSHLLRIVRPDGQETFPVPVAVEQGKTVTICYDFDRNMKCAQ
jgi:hypothetical protein